MDDASRMPSDPDDAGNPKDAEAKDAKAKDRRGTDAERSPAPDTSEASTKDDASDDGENDGPSSTRKKWTIAIVAILVVVGIIGGVAYYLYSSQYVTTDDAFIDGQIVRVAPQESGVLVKVAVDDNVHVRAGDLLASIDPAAPTATLRLRQAQLQQAKANVSQATAQIAQAEAEVEQAESTLAANTVNAENARTQADRYQELFRKSGSAAISQQALDNALTQAQQAEATARASQTAVDNAEAGVNAAKAMLESANAQVAAQEAMVASAKVDVDHLTITAPINGQVVQRNVNIGSFVQPGTQIMAIVPETLYVTANYKETQLDGIRIGAKVDISVDAFPDVDFKGTVRSIQNGAGQAFQLLPPQNATGNFVKVVQRVPVRISIDSPALGDYPIGPGMSVVPSIHAED